MGVPPSFDEVVQQFGPMIRRIAKSHEADQGLAEELAQDILFALWRALPSFRGEGSLRAFVARIAGNRSLAHVKRALRRGRSTELDEGIPAPGASPEASVIAGERQARLLAAVRALPLGPRQVVILTLEGLGAGEIAAVLGTTPNAVAVRLSRARQTLKTLMGETP
jgi:RNA polymerase sigma-70 factor (ECF subfamily)